MVVFRSLVMVTHLLDHGKNMHLPMTTQAIFLSLIPTLGIPPMPINLACCSPIWGLTQGLNFLTQNGADVSTLQNYIGLIDASAL